MQLFVFYCSTNSSFYGITKQMDGSNLPTNDCKEWISWKEINIEENSPIIGASPKEIIKSVNEKGYWTGVVMVQFSEWQ
jgi:hypothetical protein